MAKPVAKTNEDIVIRGVQYTKEQLEDVLGEMEEYVRENPGQALLYAFVAGYLLNRLPLAGIVRGLMRLALFAVRPAALVYGATKVYQAAQEK